MARSEFKHMEAAVAVTEELSFSRAAKRLRMSQPAITKYIADLEESLGVLLFVRDHHTVSLTEAGRTYVEEARLALLHAERAVQVARAAGRDVETLLNIGRSPYVDPFFTSMLLATRLPLFPKLKLNLSSGFSCDLVHDVMTGELDVAIVIEPSLSDHFTSLTIDESPLYVVISREDELAGYRTISLDQLADKRWIIFQRRSHPPLYDLIHTQAQGSKSLPSSLQHYMAPEESIPLMSVPGAVVFAAKSGALRIARAGLTMRPLEDGSLVTRTQIVCRSDNDSKALSELVRSFVRRLDHYTVDEQMSLPLRAS
jgi:DNA-binding transcriptional LysR family regulator